jgi:hypothetical protein
MNKKKDTPFWYEKPEILWQKKEFMFFFPSEKLSLVQNLNAIVRLLFYLSFFFILYTRNSQYLLLPLIGLIVTYFIYYQYPNQSFQKEEINKESYQDSYQDKECIQPTLNNPFMNFNTITDNYQRKPGCKAFLYDDPQSVETKEKITKSFNHNLYRDVSDLYGKNNSQREFFTMPWTSWPNNQTSFAKWLFRTGPTCKELGVKCSPYWNPSANYSLLEK